MQYKNVHRIEKFKNIQEPRVEKHTFSRTIQDQIKLKNIQGFQGPVATLNYYRREGYTIAVSLMLQGDNQGLCVSIIYKHDH